MKLMPFTESKYVNALTSITPKSQRIKTYTLSSNRKIFRSLFKKEKLLFLDIYCNGTPHLTNTPSHHPSETRERCHKSSSQPYENLRKRPEHQSILSQNWFTRAMERRF